MRRYFLAIVLALSPLVAQAGEMKANRAHSIELAGVHGVAYYTVEGEQYHIVALLAAGEGATPVRVSTDLASGQRITVAVPGPLGTRSTTIEITRLGDIIAVGPVQVARN